MARDRSSTHFRPQYESLLTRARDYLFDSSSRARWERTVLGTFEMPERTNYLAIAPRPNLVEEWCRRHGANPRYVRYVWNMERLRGVSDFSLIIFGGWQEQGEEMLRTGDYAMSKAKQMYFADTHKPIVREGVIGGWERR